MGLGTCPLLENIGSAQERMLMRIFERKRSIVDMLRQQAQSHARSLALHALTLGGTPPLWVLDFVPDISCSPLKAPYQKITSVTLSRSSELTCFRIDENVCIHEEELLQDELAAKETEESSEHLMTSSRKNLGNTFHEIASTMVSTSEKFPDRGSLDSVSTEACFKFHEEGRKIVGNPCESSLKSNKRNTKNSVVSSARTRTGKVVKSGLKRSNKSQISFKAKDLHKSNGAVERGNGPSNLVSNLSSFVPLLQQKQQAASLPNGKRDIKVKSLEAAEAAKRLAEKREKERQMKKEAIKIERLRIEKENTKQLEMERKQKEEGNRRKQAEIEAKKRQREGDEKKERLRKRQCLEGLNAEKKELRNKATEHKKKEVSKEIVQRGSVKGNKVSESKKTVQIEQGLDCVNYQENYKDSIGIARKQDVSVITNKDGQGGKLVLKERRESESYELSPYHDSDEEDDEENKHKKKMVPVWARRESVDRSLVSQKHTDPTDIFSRKKSCSLEEMLYVQRRERRIPPPV